MVGNLFRNLIAVTAAAIVLFTAGARADQNDPRLDELFARLQKTDSRVEAQALEQKIWNLWLKTDDPVLDLEVIAGIQAFNKGDLTEALRIFDSVTEHAPDYAEGWNKRATVLFYMSAYERSLADVARTLTLEPRHFGALSGMGMIYLKMGDEVAAAEAMERALDLHPHIPGLRRQIEDLRRDIRNKAI